MVRPAPPTLTLGQPFAVRTTTAAFEPAPMPNRAIEAPPDRLSDPMAPRLEPMVLRPDRPQGMTFGSEHLRDSVPDRSMEEMLPQGLRVPMDNLLPGARLRIPFE
ncbi:hypothetical protein [Roseomonas sp. AR75]|uniref:hypothetical protein n=1 Tax=Roseomonas sp. AR75 TaxID=2562311 RepID=UPI0010C0029A|nr:hypothetical protein [Roseomonas sp. AR75]